MARAPKIRLGVASGASNAIALARRRAPVVASKKGGYDVHEGFLIQYKRRGARVTATLLDLPHELAFTTIRWWPIDFRFGGPEFLTASSSRDGFTRGTGLKDLSLDDAESAKKERRNVRLSFSDNAPSFTYITMNTPPNPTTDSIVSTGISTDLGGAWEGDPNSYGTMPMSVDRPLGIVAHVVSHNRSFVSLAVGEDIPLVSFGRRLFARGIAEDDPNNGFFMLRPHIPYPSLTFGDDDEGALLVCPVVQSDNLTYDYGRWSLFFVWVGADLRGAVGEGIPVAGAHSRLPDLPQFESHEWWNRPGEDDERVGWLPSFLFGEVTKPPSGGLGGVYYGVYVAELYDHESAGGDPAQAPPTGFMCTLFKVDIAPDWRTTWYVLRCSVSRPGLEDRLVNATIDFPDRRLYAYTAAFTTETHAWGVYLTYSSDMGGGGQLEPQVTGNFTYVTDINVTVYRDQTEVGYGLPAGTRIGSDQPEYIRFGPQVLESQSFEQCIFSCHLNEGDLFGVSFVVIDEATGRYRLAKWESEEGFSLWDFDTEEMDSIVPAGTFPPVTCYRRQTVNDDGEVVGDPGFVVGVQDRSGSSHTYVITAGKAHRVAPVLAGAAMPMGNVLSGKGQTRDAYQDFTPPEED